ncbi:uncharacterized protein LOC135692753 [Rhopilema esculentum]|uniref:uncharacterized protein LOC135692753 n=1 Tax=Rhopilema esculentum TaxID=499914 RepID=UPI0031D901BB|eukprot:gene2421-18070_t
MAFDIEIDKDLCKHFIRLFILRGLSVFGYYLMFMDAFTSAFMVYPDHFKKYKAGAFGNVTKKTNSKDLYCDFNKKWSTKDLELLFGTHKFNLMMLMGFMGAVAVFFLIKNVVFIRLILFPIAPMVDKKGNTVISKWVKLKDLCYRASTLLGDLPAIAIAVAIYGQLRGKTGIGCWECQITETCKNKAAFDKLLNPSQLAITILYPSVVFLTFYKGFYTYYVWSNPMECECYCKCLRCCTGVFFASIFTMLMMTPGWMVLNYGYYTKPGIVKDAVSSLTEKMMLMGVIIWAVLILMLICIPVKNMLLAEKKEKK